MIPPRYKHQQQIIDDDPKKCLIAWGTGCSKTRSALELARGKTLVLCPKQQREDETWQRNAEKFGIKIDLTVLSKEDLKKKWEILPGFDTVILDECFVKGTRVLTPFGFKKIEKIKVGDVVKNLTGYGKVTKIFKNPQKEIYEIKLLNGVIIRCTGNHPFLTTRGWVIAKELLTSDLLLQERSIYLEYEKITKKVQSLWKTYTEGVASRRPLGDLARALFKRVPKYYSKEEREISPYRRIQKTSITEDENKQSDNDTRNKKETTRYDNKNGAQTKNPWWKRTGDADSSESITNRARRWVVCRTCCPHQSKKNKKWIPNLLQNRYSKSENQNSDRGGWEESLSFKTSKRRRKKNSFFGEVGVESITIQEQRSNGESESCFVYNLSVEGHPSYIVEGVIVHNCENFFGVQPDTRQRKGVQIPKTSQVFEAAYNFLKKYPPERLYFCSATPVGKPMNLWAAATLMGYKWDFFAFRQTYYTDVRIGMRRIWLPKKDEATKTRMANVIKKMGYTGSLNDFFDVPDQTHKEVYVELTDEQKVAMRTIVNLEADPLVRKARERSVENGVYYGKKIGHVSGKIETMMNETQIFPSKKIDYILERALEFPKMLIFANYTAQINEISKALRKEGYPVVELTGATKDRKNLISEADKAEACIVVAQSSISSGYELPSFPCVIFASKGWQYRFYEQSLGRVQRSNAIKKNLYIHLIVKGHSDERCHKTILAGQDFQEKLSTLDTDTIID